MLTTEERIGDDIILDRMYATEQTLLNQADALDMKASYLLIVLVFLAQLSATFIAQHDLSWLSRGSQWVSCLLLIISAVFLLRELRIKPFKVESVLKFEEQREKIITEAKEFAQYKAAAHPNDYARGRYVWSLIEGCKVRIPKNDTINARKVNHLQCAYVLTSAAFLLDILFIVLSHRLYSYL